MELTFYDRVYNDHVADPSKEKVTALPKILEASSKAQAFLFFGGKNGLHLVVSMDILLTICRRSSRYAQVVW